MSTAQPNASARHVSPYTTRQKVGRVLWGLAEATAFRWSWPTWYRYRAWLLRCFGADADPACRVRRTIRVTCPWNLSIAADAAVGEGARLYCLGLVSLGERSTVSQFAHLCSGSHDHTHPDLPLTREPIAIGPDAWVAADAFVGPGVSVGAWCILGARGCAFRDLEAGWIYGGNPAKQIKRREQFESEGPPSA